LPLSLVDMLIVRIKVQCLIGVSNPYITTGHLAPVFDFLATPKRLSEAALFSYYRYAAPLDFVLKYSIPFPILVYQMYF